ncbi:MAG: 4a-hydroxytetrahydrobiopterin dehydratase [Burkholderiaceae bacterium]
MKTLDQLLATSCRHLSGSPLNSAQIAEQLSVLDGWTQEDRSIAKDYAFADFRATMAFVNALAEMVDREDHHPEMVVGYNRCRVRFDTHSVGGISDNDFICAAKTDLIFKQLGPRRAA